MTEVPELKLALFGQSGAGKTAFFASYYGAQRGQGFAEAHGYRLVARKSTQGNALLARFHAMEDGKFPPPTDAVDVYGFDLMVGDLPTAGLHVSWLDYPGGWWERVPRDAAEREDRHRALAELVASHAIMLLLDGARLKQEGRPYLRKALHDFAVAIDGIKAEISLGEGDGADIPQIVLLAVSKADLLGDDASAEAIAKRVLIDAEREVRAVAEALGSREIPAPFVSHVMLLSSAHAPSNVQIDVRRTMGLNLVAPIAIAAILDNAASRAGSGSWSGYLASLFDFLAGLVRFVDVLDDFLPKKYQFISAILRALPLETMARDTADGYRKAREEAIRQHDVMKATAAAMFGELDGARGTRGYYHVGT